MQATLKTMTQSGTSVGWTWFAEEIQGTRFVGHNGDTFGQMAKLQLAPDRSFAFAILANSLTAGAVLQAAEAEAFSQYLKVRAGAAEIISRPLGVEELKEYAGRYEMPTTAANLTLS